jgi:hypothetical protein
MELPHVNKHVAGKPQMQELQGKSLLNSDLEIKKKSVWPFKIEKLGSPEKSVKTISRHRVTYQKSETIMKLRFINISPNGKPVCLRRQC